MSKEDKRIKFIYNQINLGLPKSLNKAIHYAKGEYIARMDADDISLLDRVEKQYKYMSENVNIDIINANYYLIDKDGIYLNKRTYFLENYEKIIKRQAINCMLVHLAVFVKHSFFMDLNGYDESLDYAEDYELRLHGTDNKKFANLPNVIL